MRLSHQAFREEEKNFITSKLGGSEFGRLNCNSQKTVDKGVIRLTITSDRCDKKNQTTER
jgi:hypothetical protein